jgi:hypothetical protein
MRRSLVVLSLLFLALPAFAQRTGVAKYAGELMSFGVGSRAFAMGGASAALADDVTAAYWNPAGLMQTRYPEIGLMHEQRYGGIISYNYGGVAWPFGPDYTLALTVTRFGIDDNIDTRKMLIDLNGNGQLDDNERLNYDAAEYFSVATWVAYLTYAYRMNEDLALGVNLKFVRGDLAEASATGIGFDVGARYAVSPRFTLGATLQDVTTTLLAWSTGTNELISPTAKLGAAYTFDIPWGTITPVVDVDIRGENRRTASTANLGPVSLDPHAGFEFLFRKLFSFRAGINDLQQFTIGAGVCLPKLYLDYAFTPSPFGLEDASTLKDGTHRISLRLALEEKRYERPAN